MTQERRKSNHSQDRWLVSYADFITLLFAFFVVLYASSQADKKKQAMVSESIETAFRALGLSGDLVLTLIGWEVMGWCSYLLIGHNSRLESARREQRRTE